MTRIVGVMRKSLFTSFPLKGSKHYTWFTSFSFTHSYFFSISYGASSAYYFDCTSANVVLFQEIEKTFNNSSMFFFFYILHSMPKFYRCNCKFKRRIQNFHVSCQNFFFYRNPAVLVKVEPIQKV